MGKYGSGVSMKSAIEMEVAEVEGILDRNHVAEIDKKAVLDALKEMAYQWCQSNAGACAVEAVLKERYKDTWDDMIKHLMTNGTYNRARMETLEETYPDWDEEDEEDEDCPEMCGYSDIIKAIRSKKTNKPKDAEGQALYWWLRGYAQCQADDVKVIENIAKGEEEHEGI